MIKEEKLLKFVKKIIPIINNEVASNNLLKFKSKKEAISREYYIKKNKALRNKLKNENLNSITL